MYYKVAALSSCCSLGFIFSYIKQETEWEKKRSYNVLSVKCFGGQMLSESHI